MSTLSDLSTLFCQFEEATGYKALKLAFLLVLSAQVFEQQDYIYPPNYITRPTPTYNPQQQPCEPSCDGGSFGDFRSGVHKSAGGLLGLFTGSSSEVPDNACQRSIDGSPLIFDYVIVGTGGCGSVVASRLSENPNVTVLLIESGSGPDYKSVAPFLYTTASNNTNKTWPDHAECNQDASLVFKNGCPMHSGKSLGGTTSINPGFWALGNKQDFNGWCASGAKGWDYDSIFPYFLKIENNTDPSKSCKYNRTGGPLTISSNVQQDPFVTTIKTGWKQLGYDYLPEYMDCYVGVTDLQSCSKNGERQDSFQGYLKPAKNRLNLYFAQEGVATKIVFKGKTAVGVNVQTGICKCANILFQARKKVILSAGAFGSAKLLLQSGVGPKDQLKKLNIPVVKNLPVGKNLQEHPVGELWIKLNPSASPQNFEATRNTFSAYLYNRTGDCAQIGTSYVNAFINLTNINATYPDVRITAFHFQKNQAYLIDAVTDLGYNDNANAKLVSVNKDFELLFVRINLLNPKSRGCVELRGTDPNLSLKITSGFYSDPDNCDRSTMSKGFLKVGELIKTDAWNNTNAELIEFDLPLCKSIPFATEAYWDCYTRYFTASGSDATGTNKMGAACDKSAVVDPKLKVRGIKNLHVIDSSVMPSIVAAPSQATAYTIAEKGVDMIKH